MRLIGQSEQRAIDRRWQEQTGLPLLLLMEAAATAVKDACLDMLDQAHAAGQVLVLAGKGQNGGDAYACARLLHAAGCSVVCRELFPGCDLPEEALANRCAASGLGLGLGAPVPEDFAGLGPGSLIVDGIFGTGFRATRELPAAVVRAGEQTALARRRGCRVLAIDVPTGLDADSGELAAGAFRADLTVTFIRPKIGLCAAPGRFAAGQVQVAAIGVPDSLADAAIDQLSAAGLSGPETRLADHDDIKSLRPERPADSHKGSFGQVLVLAGAPGMPGAAILAAEAAARSGAGLLTVAAPAAIGPLLLEARPEGLLNLLPDDVPAAADLIGRLLDRQPAVAAGPGAGLADWLAAALPALIGRARNLLLDADALNLMAQDTGRFFALLRARRAAGLPPAILTPHPGEFRRLLPDCAQGDRQAAARRLAAASGCVIVLKGAATAVAEPDGLCWINPTGNDGLARGGSGDVLAGLTAGLLAQGLQPTAAARAGAWLHGLAADLAAARLGRRALLPSDIIAALGDAFRAAGWEDN